MYCTNALDSVDCWFFLQTVQEQAVIESTRPPSTCLSLSFCGFVNVLIYWWTIDPWPWHWVTVCVTCTGNAHQCPAWTYLAFCSSHNDVSVNGFLPCSTSLLCSGTSLFESWQALFGETENDMFHNIRIRNPQIVNAHGKCSIYLIWRLFWVLLNFISTDVEMLKDPAV